MPVIQTTQQLNLLPDDPNNSPEALTRKKALELYLRSRLLRQQHSSFEVLMADPVSGRCVQMAAAALVRSALRRSQKTQGQ